jgi:hypothetical protein
MPFTEPFPRSSSAFGVGVRIAERAVDVDLPQGRSREGEGHVPGTHADEHDLAAGHGSVDGELDAWLGTGALEDDVEAIGLAKGLEGISGVLLGPYESLLGCCGPRTRG